MLEYAQFSLVKKNMNTLNISFAIMLLTELVLR